jgi:hypothetical protein
MAERFYVYIRTIVFVFSPSNFPRYVSFILDGWSSYLAEAATRASQLPQQIDRRRVNRRSTTALSLNHHLEAFFNGNSLLQSLSPFLIQILLYNPLNITD